MLTAKLKEAAISVIPIALLSGTFICSPSVKLPIAEAVTFSVATGFLIIGIAIFNLGSDLAMTPMGEYIGTGLSEPGRPSIFLPVTFIIGVFITIAEPDLSVLASQVSNVINETVLTITLKHYGNAPYTKSSISILINCPKSLFFTPHFVRVKMLKMYESKKSCFSSGFSIFSNQQKCRIQHICLLGGCCGKKVPTSKGSLWGSLVGDGVRTSFLTGFVRF